MSDAETLIGTRSPPMDAVLIAVRTSFSPNTHGLNCAKCRTSSRLKRGRSR